MFPEQRGMKMPTYLGHELTVLIEMYGLEPTIVEQLSLMAECLPGIEDIGCREREHRPREWTGECAGVFPMLEELQLVTFVRYMEEWCEGHVSAMCGMA